MGNFGIIVRERPAPTNEPNEFADTNYQLRDEDGHKFGELTRDREMVILTKGKYKASFFINDPPYPGSNFIYGSSVEEASS